MDLVFKVILVMNDGNLNCLKGWSWICSILILDSIPDGGGTRPPSEEWV